MVELVSAIGVRRPHIFTAMYQTHTSIVRFGKDEKLVVETNEQGQREIPCQGRQEVP